MTMTDDAAKTANETSRLLRETLRGICRDADVRFFPTYDKGNNPPAVGRHSIFGTPLKAPLQITQGQSAKYPKGLIIQPVYQDGRGNAYKNAVLTVLANQFRYPRPVMLVFAGQAFSEYSNNDPAIAYRALRSEFVANPEGFPGLAFVGTVPDFRLFILANFTSLDVEVA